MELSSIYNTAPIGLAVLDTQLRFLRINERLAAINGRSVQEHIGRTVAEIVPEIAPQAERVLRRILATGQPLHDVEIRGCTPSEPGVERVWREQFTPLRDEAGAIVAISVVAEEITGQREAEADRREQAQLLELASDAIFVWNRGGAIERWNHGAELVYGYTAGEALGRIVHELLATEFPVPLADILACCERHGIWRGELTHRCKDGRRIRVQATMQRVRAQPDRVLEITRDITAERDAFDRLAASERQLQANRNRLDVALEAGRMGIWEWLPGSDQAWWSPQVFRLVEQPETADGRASAASFLERVDPQDRPALDAQLARALDETGDYEAEFRLHAPSGRTRWLLSRGRVLHAGGAEGSRLIGINLDITGQKALEETLRDSEARRNEFLAMLGHELRNPLAPITNAVRLLEHQGLRDEKQATAVQIIKRQSQHMARLVDDLLEVSRITQGRIELRMENVLVATTTYAAVETARPLARDKEQKIEVSVPPDLDVVADPARLTQVLSNLVMNAVKYTPAGGHIRVAARPSGDRFLEIEVADDGMGIAPDLMPKIFELFTQDRRTLDRSEGGLGLGLALVKRLVELHGGRVDCRSAGQGQGATFTVCLPRQGRRGELRANEAHPAAARMAPTSVLVVDDNRDAAETMASLLELDGHRVRLAFDGLQALEIAAHDVPRVVLLDIGLPGMSGLDVARRMRETPSLAGATIIGMSGYAQAEDRAAAEAAGFDAHLAKPAEVADVYRAIEQLRA